MAISRHLEILSDWAYTPLRSWLIYRKTSTGGGIGNTDSLIKSLPIGGLLIERPAQ